ncbi:hypothetical protein FBU59_006542 [Linderina macrospora]|uniref:Uncharacterized protein n=1 Tax=Linderina macrospora TaxID=4868 RepID=A0ACC1IZH9_9FUNG|nr:hypothetical protein FBU59_006542 [Linderina macrospora]
MLGPQARLVRTYKAHRSGRLEYKVPVDAPVTPAAGKKTISNITGAGKKKRL